MTPPSLILVSSSPRRRELLTALGISLRVRAAEVDEEPREGEDAEQMVLRLAIAKATAIVAMPDEIVLGADTAVVLDGKIFGKPRDEADALRMLGELSGRAHRVLTGVAVCRRGRLSSALSNTEVQFREIDPDEARCYWHSGEPRDKAGAYAIQGRGGMFVKAIMGSYSGVVGLPVFETARLLRDAGLELLPAR
ncbi:MAG: Maf family nucleotide pyrophosphatase [Gammaproteobacteria bacterium]|nr:Maf family nucleotide pyrophosphatase [Gammaproteobacteria bacterium]